MKGFQKILCGSLTYSNYSHFSNKQGGWNKHEGETKIAKSLNVEAGIKLSLENIYEINKRGGGFILLRVEFFKVGKYDFIFIIKIRVH